MACRVHRIASSLTIGLAALVAGLCLSGCLTQVDRPPCFEAGGWSDALVSTVCCAPGDGEESDRACRKSALEEALPAAGLAHCRPEGVCGLRCVRAGVDGGNCECTDGTSCVATGAGSVCAAAEGTECDARGLASPCTLCLGAEAPDADSKP